MHTMWNSVLIKLCTYVVTVHTYVNTYIYVCTYIRSYIIMLIHSYAYVLTVHTYVCMGLRLTVRLIELGKLRLVQATFRVHDQMTCTKS